MIEHVSYGGQSSALLDKELTERGGGDTSATVFLEYLARLAQYKRFVLMWALGATVAGAAYSYWIPEEFMSTTRIMTPQQTPSSASLLMAQLASSSGSGALMSAASGSLGLKNPNDMYVGLLSSRPIADAIIQKFGLKAAYKATDMTAARKKLTMSTQVRAEKSGFIAVTVTDNSKKRAADIANAYTDELRNLTKTLAVTEASQRRLFYEEQLAHAKEDLIAAEVSFQQVEKKKGVVQPDAQVKALIEGLAAIQAQVAAKQVELRALRSYSTESNPNVQLVENELASLQAEASRLDQRSHASGGADFGLQDVASAGIDYLRAARDLQYRQGIFDLLLKQYDAARLDEAKEAAVIQVVEPAIPPDKRSAPHRTVVVLLFTMIGFMGACGYLYVRDLGQRHPAVVQSLGTLKTALLKR